MVQTLISTTFLNKFLIDQGDSLLGILKRGPDRLGPRKMAVQGVEAIECMLLGAGTGFSVPRDVFGDRFQARIHLDQYNGRAK